MAIQENVAINFVTSYQGKGLNQAKSQVSSFETLANKAAKTFAGLFATKKIIDFGKASVDAFTADQKALALLDQTLVNVGLGFQALGIDKYITDVSLATGVTKDNLIPAFETLARYTSNVAKSQQLLQLALDISAGTGKDLASVTTALGKAYGGNTTALGRLGAGLSQTVLKSKNFALIQDQLTTKFSGDASTAADTYAGKIARLNVAFNELKVTIGQGLVTGFENLAGNNGSLSKSITMIEDLGYVISGFIQSVGGGLGWIISGVEKLMNNPVTRFFFNLAKKSGLNLISDWFNMGKTAAYNELLKKNTTLIEKTYAAQTKSLKTSTAQLAIDKAALVLKQASKTLDLTAIQDYAALQQATSADDKNRLQLMQAILDQNATAAANFSQKVLAANGLVMDLQGNIKSDPFAAWNQSIQNFNADMQTALDKAAKMQTLLVPPTSASSIPATPAASTSYGSSTALSSAVLNTLAASGDVGFALAAANYQNQTQEIKVTVDPTAMAYGISLATQTTSSNGTTNNLSRNNPIYLNP